MRNSGTGTRNDLPRKTVRDKLAIPALTSRLLELADREAAGTTYVHSSVVIRLGVVLIVSSIAVVASAAVADTRAYWSVPKVIRAIDNAPVRVRGRVVRVDGDTTLCAGRGATRRVRGIRRWRLFACTYTTFSKRKVDRDLDFKVRVLDARRFVISDARWVAGSRAAGLRPTGLSVASLPASAGLA
jgi:hypothetical protein